MAEAIPKKKHLQQLNDLMESIFLKRIMLFMSISLIFMSCKNDGLGIDAPACIEEKIEAIIAKEVSNPPTQVWRWIDDGQTYYYITSDCCDQYNYLYDINCELVCAPDGGITGNGDGNCPSFSTEIEKTLIWEDSRN